MIIVGVLSDEMIYLIANKDAGLTEYYWVVIGVETETGEMSGAIAPEYRYGYIFMWT